MTNTNRWLNELPTDSAEHDLLVAGKNARPPAGALEADWQALCVALSAGAAATAVTTTSAAAVAGKAASATVATQAVASGVAVYAKSVAIGFAFGVGVLGAHALVQRMTQSGAPAAIAAPPAAVASAPSSSVARRSVSNDVAAPVVSVQPPSVPAAPTSLAQVPTAALPSLQGPSAASKSAASRAVAAATPPQVDRPGEPSLAERARELAQVKRLLDAGASLEALRRLETSSAEDARSALSEERDALHVQALDNSHRRAEAQRLAKQFLTRYPKSPHVEKMRQLIADE